MGPISNAFPSSNSILNSTSSKQITKPIISPGTYNEYWTSTSVEECPNQDDKFTVGSPRRADLSPIARALQASSVQKENLFHASIPVVDMQEFYTNKEGFIKNFEVAMKNGFIAVTNFGLDPIMLDAAYSTMEQFYRLPLEVKQKFADPKDHGQRGFYVGEKAADAKEADLTKEFYGVGQNLSKEELIKYGIKFQNQWGDPKETGIDLETPMVALYESLFECSKPILRALSLGLGLEEDYLVHEFIDEKGDTLMRSLHYLEGVKVEEEIAGKHTDICALTILPKATSEGLQIQTPDGNFIDVVVPEGAVIINLGDMLQNLTNGAYRSVVHRVVAKGSSPHDSISCERFSVVFFIHPRGDFSLNPLQKFIDEVGQQKYPNATAWELLSERLVAINLIKDRDGIAEVASSGVEERLIAYGKGNLHVAKQFIDQGVASQVVIDFYNANSKEV